MLSDIISALSTVDPINKLKSIPKTILDIAPDAFVLINGKDGLPVWGDDSELLDFNSDIESISITHSIDDGIPTATIKFKNQIYSSKKYFISEGFETSIYNYAEVEIYMKGRFLVKTSNGLNSNYYKVFHGYAYNFSTELTLNCFGIVNIWEKVYVDFNPVSNNFFIFSRDIAPYKTQGQNVFDIIYEIINKQELPENADEDTLFQHLLGSQQNLQIAFNQLKDQSNYWSYYFSQCRKNISVFDTHLLNSMKNKFIKVNTSINGETKSGNNKTKDLKDTNMFSSFHPDTFLALTEEISGVSKFSAIKTVANLIFYEFYQDTNGSIVVKPEFTNLDTRNIKQNVINPQDIIDLNIIYNFDDMLSKVYVTGKWNQGDTTGGSVIPTGIYTDLNSSKKFGLKIDKISHPLLTSPKHCAQYAKIYLHRNNFTKNRSGGMTIAMRPELRLGYPLYINHKDIFVYPRTITHSIQFGSTATTEITFDSIRSPFVAEKRTTDEITPNDFRPEIAKINNENKEIDNQTIDISHASIKQFFAENTFIEAIKNPELIKKYNLNNNTFIVLEKQEKPQPVLSKNIYANIKNDFVTTKNPIILKGDLARKIRLKNIFKNLPIDLINSFDDIGIEISQEYQNAKKDYEDAQQQIATDQYSNPRLTGNTFDQAEIARKKRLEESQKKLEIAKKTIQTKEELFKKIIAKKNASIFFDKRNEYIRLKGDLNAQLIYILSPSQNK